MRPTLPRSSAPKPIEPDFDWPPAHDELSVHALDGEPWSQLQAASNEAFAHRHGDPAPPRRVARPSAQLAVVVGVAAALAVAAWAMRHRLTPVAAEVPPAPIVASTVVIVPAKAPPRLTIRATYPVDDGGAEPAAVQPAPEPALTPTLPAVEEPPPAASSTIMEPPVSGGPAIDETPAPAPVAGEAAPTPATAPTASGSARADEDIRDLLRRYEAAYDRRDVATAATLWPTLDQRTLSRAFASLHRQDVSFERCDIDASEGRGSAVCVGTLRYVPRVGRGVEKEGRITWTFDLTRAGEDWRISHLSAR